MARDWNEPDTITLLLARINDIAPGNVAPCPLACAMQREPDGTYTWYVDIHVRIPRVTEYEITAAGDTVTEALRKAYKGLNNEVNLRTSANAANRAFRVAV